MSNEKQIFKEGSTTFFNSSIFFPKTVKQDVFDLYSFVRVADDYVDQVPPDSRGFSQLRRVWETAQKSESFHTDKRKDDEPLELRVVKNMLRVARKHNFDPKWIDSFFDSMQADLESKKYQTLDETLQYIHGSAEVIGLMMARIMELKPEAYKAAMLQGRAMQFINFIRDLDEDNRLGRQYFPEEDLQRFNLKDLSRQTALSKPKEFSDFVQFQLARYKKWQDEAAEGYPYIPYRLRIPVKTAADMYDWTARKIEKNPELIFGRKIKPSKPKVFGRIIINSLNLGNILS